METAGVIGTSEGDLPTAPRTDNVSKEHVSAVWTLDGIRYRIQKLLDLLEEKMPQSEARQHDDRGPPPDFVRETGNYYEAPRYPRREEPHSNVATVVIGIGIIVSIIGSAWKISTDVSEFKGAVLQWQVDHEKQLDEVKQQVEHLRGAR